MCGSRAPIVLVAPTLVEDFFVEIVPWLTTPVVLVLAGNDFPFPSRVFAAALASTTVGQQSRVRPPFPRVALDHPMIKHIFTTNLNVEVDGSLRHPKLSAIPLGTEPTEQQRDAQWGSPRCLSSLV
jgi:hypothetical protein